MLADFSTINDAFRDAVKMYPNKAAIIFQDEKLTFTEVDAFAEKIAAFFYHKGLKRQDRIILYLPHMPEWINVWLAMQRLGVTVIPFTHFYGFTEISYIGNDSGAKTIFCGDKNFEQVVNASEEYLFDTIVIIGDDYDAELVKRVSAMGTEVIFYSNIMSGDVQPLPDVQIADTDIAEILYTGGTTGFPKGVPLTNSQLVMAMQIKRDMFISLLPMGAGVALQGAPLFHILGKELGISSLLCGDSLILLPKMNVDDIFRNMEKHKVTTFFGTPTLLRMMLDHKNINKYNFDSIVYVFVAGEALPLEIYDRWKKRFKIPPYQGYGSTETCGGITGIPVEENHPPGTTGKIVPSKRALLLNPETKEPVGPGEPGELYVTSDNMVTAYLNKPEETARHFVEMEGRLWYNTGDIVRYDENGWFFFVDRSVDMIKTKGYSVTASKVEAVIYKHEAVNECCVIGIPDEKDGEKLKAFIVLKEGYENTKGEDITEWCMEKLASYEVPYLIEFKKNLPKSLVHKILRRIIRDEERKLFEQQKEARDNN